MSEIDNILPRSCAEDLVSSFYSQEDYAESYHVRHNFRGSAKVELEKTIEDEIYRDVSDVLENEVKDILDAPAASFALSLSVYTAVLNSGLDSLMAGGALGLVSLTALYRASYPEQEPKGMTYSKAQQNLDALEEQLEIDLFGGTFDIMLEDPEPIYDRKGRFL